MILSTHAIVGAAVSSFFPAHPVVGVAAAFASHFVLDSIPHWDYSIPALKAAADHRHDPNYVMSPLALVDIGRLIFDVSLGGAVTLLLIVTVPAVPAWIFLGGAFFGMLPDLLAFWSRRFRPRWLRPLDRFHYAVHSRVKFTVPWFVGAAWQALIMLAAMLAVYYS